MEENNTISKERKLPQSQDYEFLRQEGLKYIESLSRNLWTDYNIHDPGITILEALCYAITELGYRSGFDMKDLLTKEKSKIFDTQNFFTPRQILPNSPLTIKDYRKLLIDLDGVHNAFLFSDEKVGEVNIYINPKEDELQYDPAAEALNLSGLYRVLLDLESDDLYGDLNNGNIIVNNPKTNSFLENEFKLSVGFHSWKNADFLLIKKASDENNISSIVISNDKAPWKCELILTDSSKVQFSVSVAKSPARKKVTKEDISAMFDVSISGIRSFMSSIINLYQNKITRAGEIVREAKRTLMNNRNLCEDFYEVTTLDTEEIAFCFDVDLKPESDIEKVQAEIFFAIENYMNPPVEFYSLKEMLDKKIPADEIFEGTALKNGFLDTAQLDKAGLRKVIYASDIINDIMEIQGVNAVRNFMMTRYDAEGKAIKNFTGVRWCMEITPFHKPVLSIDRSKVLLFKDQFPFLAEYNEVNDTIKLLHTLRSRQKLKGYDNDIPVPEGEKRDTASYWPVQYDLPLSYGTGETGLPSTAPAQRIAQQRQLKAYLMFYEQLLSDFFSQLSNAYKLFSIEDIKQTYFAQFLGDIKDIEDVYYKKQPDNKEPMLKDVLASQDSTLSSRSGWQDLYESKDLFEERRNRFLDHLLARFSENFNDYALLVYKMNYDKNKQEKVNPSKLTGTKIKTLKEYDKISSQRAKAFNYFPEENLQKPGQMWNTENVSGIEKRICSTTGIENYARRFLYCIRNVKIEQKKVVVKKGKKEIVTYDYGFSLTTLNGYSMHTAGNYASKEAAIEALAQIIEAGKDKSNYSCDEAEGYLQLNGNNGNSKNVLLRTDSNYSSKEEAMAVIDEFVSEFSRECEDPEGLHLIEHILLRPRSNDFKLMQICRNDCGCPGRSDPYSCLVTVVLPYWPEEFSDMNFRQYFENKIREEAPAHIILKVCWLNNELMREFEAAYKKWIETLAGYSLDPSDTAKLELFKHENDKMIAVLSGLHSEYPEATLFNCHESEEEVNAVVLGKTVLGTLKD